MNLSQPNEQVPHCRQALDMILALEPDEELEDNPNQRTLIKQSAKMLYGFTQTTYVLTNLGTTQMLEKVPAGRVWLLPHVRCENKPMLSNSLSDTPGEALVKLYCPKCMDISTPKTPSRKHHTEGPYLVLGYQFPSQCSSRCTLNAGPSSPLTSLCPKSTVARFIHCPTRCSSKPPATLSPSRPFSDSQPHLSLSL